ncbi:MAG: hypothetical protein ACERKN_09345 [Velocimicrobium sp.]
MKKYSHYSAAIVGVILLGIGFYLMKMLSDSQSTLPYVCIGVGAGFLGGGMSEIIQKRAIGKNPKLAKELEITRLDERNVTIANKAKAKAYDMMVFIFGALMLTYTLMNADLKEILLLVASYLFIIGYGLYFRIKYDKEM